MTDRSRIADIVRQANTRGLLAVNEIYPTIQGESTYAGRPCVIVRLTGCSLRCSWCDTTYAYFEGRLRGVDDVLDEVLALGITLVEVTGGEPLEQRAARELLSKLAGAGLTVVLETSGAADLAEVDPRVVRIMDIKPPDSGQEHRNRWENIDRLRRADEVKFVLASREDYAWAREKIRGYELESRCTVLLSPILGALEPATLAAWILEDRLDVRLQVQLHKLIWPPDARGV